MSLADDSAESTKLRYCHKNKAGNYECVKKQQMDRKGQIKSKVNNLNVIFNRICNVQPAFKSVSQCHALLCHVDTKPSVTELDSFR